MTKATKATKAKTAVGPILSKAGPGEQVYTVGEERTVALSDVKVKWQNLNRPGFDVTKTPVPDLQREWQAAGGQVNPCLVSDNGDGTVTLLGGYRRFRTATLETEAGRHNGTLKVKVVAPAPGVTMTEEQFAALANYKENNSAALPTGVEGRIASFTALQKLGWTLDAISRYCGGVAVDVVNDSLHLAQHPRLLAAVRAFEAGESTFDEPVLDKAGKATGEVKTFPSGPFGVARLLVRKADEWAKDAKTGKADEKFTMWQAWTRTCHLRVADAAPAVKALRGGEKAYAAYVAAKNPPKAAPPAPPVVTVVASTGTPDANPIVVPGPTGTPPVTVLPPAPAPKGKTAAPVAPVEPSSGMNIRQDTATEDAVRAAGAKALAPALARLRAVLAADKPSAATVAEALEVLNGAVMKGACGAFTTATWEKTFNSACAALSEE